MLRSMGWTVKGSVLSERLNCQRKDMRGTMVRLLDCTLRDGGYVNDWEFGHSNLCSVFERLTDTGVDIIETGFLDERRPFDINRSIMPDTQSVTRIYGGIAKRPPMVVGMIDFGTCSIEHIQPCENSFLDGIRVIFKKYRMKEAMEFCAELKKLGYLVFSQLVSVTDYSDAELMELIELVNEVRPYAVSMVDTYGLLKPDSMRHIYSLLDEHVHEGIGIGFHAHNNLQLAFANTMAFLEYPTQRDVIVDGTLYGMGKSAGNAPLELVAMHLNEVYGKNYKVNPMLEAIEESILEFYQKTPWGYKMYFYLSAYNKVHPDYVRQIQNKPNVSVTALNDILGNIQPAQNKLLYDKMAGERAYAAYENDQIADEVTIGRLREAFAGERPLLLVGPGKSMQLQRDKIEEFIAQKQPMILSINYVPKMIQADYVFVTKTNRYKEMADQLLDASNQGIQLIATSNVTPRGQQFSYVISREPLLEQAEEIVDNSLLMLLRVLRRCGLKELYLAGFDGYSDSEDNYFNPHMEYAFVKNEARHLNRHIRSVLENEYSDMCLHFVTYSRYITVEDSYGAAF